MPGNGVAAVSVRPAATISPRPSHPATARARVGIVVSLDPRTASSPPTPSSQARVGSEKNAHGPSAVVSQSESANDPTHTAASASPTRRTRADRQASDEQDQRRPEQVELLLHAERPVVEQR